MRRRFALATAGAATLSVLAGCGFVLDQNRREPGSLVVNNNHNSAHTVTVIVREYRDRPASDSEGVATPTGTPLDQRTATVDVPAGNRVTRSEFISTPGTYYVVARTTSGLRAVGWADFYEGRGSTIGGGIIYVNLQENGFLTVSNVSDD